MKVKINNLVYHRNGVIGDPFYSCLLNISEGTEVNTVIFTFKTNETDTAILAHSCRAVNIENPTMQMRGDEIGRGVQLELNKLMGEHDSTIYDIRHN